MSHSRRKPRNASSERKFSLRTSGSPTIRRTPGRLNSIRTVARPSAEVNAPFVTVPGTTIPVVDIGAINGDRDATASGFPHYVDVTFNPVGAGLDYASIYDTAAEIEVRVNNTLVTLSQPIAIELVADPATGVLIGRVFVLPSVNGLDDVSLTMVKQEKISGYEEKVKAARPWL